MPIKTHNEQQNHLFNILLILYQLWHSHAIAHNMASKSTACVNYLSSIDGWHVCQLTQSVQGAYLSSIASYQYTFMQDKMPSMKRTLTDQVRESILASESNHSPSRHVILIAFLISVLTSAHQYFDCHEVHRRICRLVFEALRHALGRVSGDND